MPVGVGLVGSRALSLDRARWPDEPISDAVPARRGYFSKSLRFAPKLMWNGCPSITSAGTDLTPACFAAAIRSLDLQRWTTTTTNRPLTRAAATDFSALTHTGHPAW